MAWILACTLILALGLGCGGSSDDDNNDSTSNGSFAVFLTDDLNAGYEGVWVTLHSATAVGSGDTPYTLFESTEGMPINLRSLGSEGGSRFYFLGPASLPTGTYTHIDLVFDQNVRLFTTGGGTGTNTRFRSAFDQGANRSRVRVNLTPNFTVNTGSTNQDLVLDFDLSAWTSSDGSINPVVTRHNGEGLNNLSRHETGRYAGVVEGASGNAPNRTFRLRFPNGLAVRVSSSATTFVVGNSGGGFPLNDSNRVVVEGVYDVLTDTLVASQVLEDDGDNNEDEVYGMISASSNSEGTLSLTMVRSLGFTPTMSPVVVEIDMGTQLWDASGATLNRSDFFNSAGMSGMRVYAEGSWNESNNRFRATRLRLSSGSTSSFSAVATGTLSDFNSEGGSFMVNVTGGSSSGFTPPAGGSFRAELESSAQFRNMSGSSITREQFFAGSIAGQRARISGRWEGSTFYVMMVEQMTAPA